MRLFEAIVDANHSLSPGELQAKLKCADFTDALPLAALTCIDPRLNRLLPHALGVPEEKFIWLRNAGNIVTDVLSSTVRSIALACAIKKAREIAIIGHTDCRVASTNMMELTNQLQALGVDRSRLPENLTQYFGLFASERQNVMKAVDLVRRSPAIGPKIPVHGALIDIKTGRLDWVINGYQTSPSVISDVALNTETNVSSQINPGLAAPVNLNLLKFPDFKIGEMPSMTQPIEVSEPKVEKVQTPVPKAVAGNPSTPPKLPQKTKEVWRQLRIIK